MVNFEIPENYSASPSYLSGTPSLTINHEATIGLDSTHAFEGVEKLLEVWLCADPNSLPHGVDPQGLKVVPAKVWETMLDLVHCKVLSVLQSNDVDAYLLSESSMFVFPHKLILKTCGTTTLLYGLPKILEIAKTMAGFPHVSGDMDTGLMHCATPYRVFYSRKNFLYPERQVGPHRSWRDEVKTLDQLFMGGSAYLIGKMNGDHWYLYITEPNSLLTPPATPPAETKTVHLDVPSAAADLLCRGSFANQQDETLEVLMTDLCLENAEQFYLANASQLAEKQFFQRAEQIRREAQGDTFIPSGDVFDMVDEPSLDNSQPVKDQTLPEELTTEGHALGSVVADASGLSDLYPVSKYPEARLDSYVFSPCGFSSNAIIPAPSESGKSHYFTVHVTPEPVASYASFETNVPCKQTGKETIELIEQVVQIFQPGRFSVTLFETKQVADEGITGVKDFEKVRGADGLRVDSVTGYKRIERIVHDLDGYDLVFRQYEKVGMQNGRVMTPRLGEAF